MSLQSLLSDIDKEYKKGISESPSFLRPHDIAVTSWLNSIRMKVINDAKEIELRRVPNVFSTPNRAFASMNLLLGDMDYNEGSQIAESRRSMPIPLPFISIQRDPPTYDTDRPRPHPSVFSNFRFWNCDPMDMRPYRTIKAPEPWNIAYNIECWTQTREEYNELMEWFLDSFQMQRAYLRIPIGGKWDAYNALTILDSIVDNSDLEPGDPDNRMLRFTVSITIQAWRHYALVAIEKLVEQIKVGVNLADIDICIGKSGKLLKNISNVQPDGGPVTILANGKKFAEIDPRSPFHNYWDEAKCDYPSKFSSGSVYVSQVKEALAGFSTVFQSGVTPIVGGSVVEISGVNGDTSNTFCG